MATSTTAPIVVSAKCSGGLNSRVILGAPLIRSGPSVPPILLPEQAAGYWSRVFDMTTEPAALYLQDLRVQVRKLKDLADKALAQVRDEDLTVTLDPESNSLAVILQH